MAKKFLTSLDLAANQIIDARIENLASFPTAGKSGRAVWNTTTSKLGLDNGSAFVNVAIEGHAHAISDVTGLQTALDAKAPLASPALTGTPTAPTATPGTNTTQLATTAFVQAAVTAGSVASLGDVGDVTLTSIASGELLKWNGSGWENNTLAEAGIAAASHAHIIGDVTGLQTALDGKAASSHSHTSGDISDFATAVNTQVVAYWDSIADTDADIDTIRELMDLVLSNESGLANLIGRYNADVGDGASTSIAVTHSLNSLDVCVEVYEISSGDTIICDVTRDTVNQISLGFASAPSTDSLRVVVKK